MAVFGSGFVSASSVPHPRNAMARIVGVFGFGVLFCL